MIANASRGEFLVKLQTTHGTRSYRVAVDLHPNELTWWDTTAGMRSTNRLAHPGGGVVTGPGKPPGTGAFAIEKAVVITGAVAAAGLAAVHGTGLLLALVTGRPLPPFGPAHAVGLLQGTAYVPGVPPAVHGTVIAVAVVVALLLASSGPAVAHATALPRRSGARSTSTAGPGGRPETRSAASRPRRRSSPRPPLCARAWTVHGQPMPATSSAPRTPNRCGRRWSAASS